MSHYIFFPKFNNLLPKDQHFKSNVHCIVSGCHYMFIYASILSASVCLSVCLFLYLSIYLSMYLAGYLSNHLQMYLTGSYQLYCPDNYCSLALVIWKHQLQFFFCTLVVYYLGGQLLMGTTCNFLPAGMLIASVFLQYVNIFIMHVKLL